MIKLKLFYEILRGDEEFSKLNISFEPVDTEEANTSAIRFDPQRIRINFGMRSVYIFGRTENGQWVYYATVYNHSGEPVGPFFWAIPGAEEKLLDRIRRHLVSYQVDFGRQNLSYEQ